MIDLGPHATYIITAYLGTAAVIAGIIFFAILDTRRQRARLAALDARGIHRRSAQKGPAK